MPIFPNFAKIMLENTKKHYTEQRRTYFFLKTGYDECKKVVFFVKLHLKMFFLKKNTSPLNFCYSGITFLVAFCHKDKVTSLKSTQKYEFFIPIMDCFKNSSFSGF
jgi:hypothetical protein